MIRGPQAVRLTGRKPPQSIEDGDAAADRTRTDARAGLTVLVVDDAPDVRDLYALYFQHIGLRVLTAQDGQSAIAAVRVHRPDAIVLDLAMPGVTGWDVIRELKGSPQTRAIPILVLSGQQARDSALKVGADGYVEKPCLPEKLFGELMRVLYGGH